MFSSLPLVQKSQITFHSASRKAHLKSPIPSLVQASYSTVLSLANFILCHDPNLHPPNYSGTFCSVTESNTAQYPQQYLTYNKLFEPWCDYLSELFMKNKVSQQMDVCFMWDQVGEDYIDLLKEDVFEIKAKNGMGQKGNEGLGEGGEESFQILQEQQDKQKRPRKKIGIINFALSQLRTDFIKPKMHLIGLFTGIFYNQGDQWKAYNVLKSQYPTQEQYMQLDTVILSGSSLSVNDQTPQIVGFVETLKKAVIYNPKLKILGICFGHQTLAKMFGGKIVSKKLLTGVETIHFDESLIHQTPYFRRTDLAESTFELSEYHKDFVVEIPQNFDIFAQSQTCKIESLISKNKKYLSFQFHPEYSAEYIKGFEMRLQHYQVYDLKSSYSHTKRGSIKHNSSLWEIRRIIRNFMDWEVKLQN